MPAWVLPAVTPPRAMLWLMCPLLVLADLQMNVDFATPIHAPGPWMGVGAVMHGFDYMSEDSYRGWDNAAAAVSNHRLATSHTRIARTWYGPDWTMTEWGAPLNFSTPKFQQFARWVADMQRDNVTVAMAAGWWLPANTCGIGPPGKCTPVPAKDLPIYAKWVSASVHELVVVRGLSNVKILVAWTEPLDYDSGTYPTGYTRESYYAATIAELHTQLVADNVRHLIRIQGPNSAPTPGNLAFARELHAAGHLDLASGHTYNQPNYASWLATYTLAVDQVRNVSFPFIVDEGGKSDEAFRNTTAYGTYLAAMNAAAINAGASATTMWLLRDQYYVWPLENASGHDGFYNGLHRWGVQPWLPYATTVRPAWYVVDMLMRLMGPLEGRHGVTAVVSSPQTGQVAVAAVGDSDETYGCQRAMMLVNEGATATAVDIHLLDAVSGTCAAGTTLYRYVYDPAAVPANSLPLPAGRSLQLPTGSNCTLSDSLPAGSVVVWSTELR